MPSSLLFDGNVGLSVQGSALFTPVNGFLYFETPGNTEPLDVWLQLKLLLPGGSPRIVPLYRQKACQDTYKFQTDALVLLPTEINPVQLDFQVFAFAYNEFALRIHHYYEDSGCDCAAELEEIKRKVDQIQFTQIATKVLDLAVNALTGGVAGLIFDAIPAGDALRTGVELLNPSSSPVYIGYQPGVSATNYARIIPPGGTLNLPGYQGSLHGFSPTGVQLQAFDFRAE